MRARCSVLLLTICSAIITLRKVVSDSTYAAVLRSSQSTMEPVTPSPETVLLDAGRLLVRINSRSGSLEITSRGGLVASSSLSSPYIRSGGDIRQLVLKAASTSTGCDALGCFSTAILEWRMAPESSVVTAVRAYAAQSAIVFSTQFQSALHGTSSARPCGFIGGPSAGLFNDCGLASAYPRLSFGGAYRNWLSWAGGGNSPEPVFGSFDAMVAQSAFLKQDYGVGGGNRSRIARGVLTLAYDGRARASRTVQQELDAISLAPPWGQSPYVRFGEAKAFCMAERRCKGFSWQAGAARGMDPAAEPAPREMVRVRHPVTNRPTFVTDAPADGKGKVPLAFYESSAAVDLGGLVAGPIVLPCAGGVNDTVALMPLGNFMSSSHEYDLTSGSLDFGVLGSVGSIPAGYKAEMLMVIDDGFNAALRKAGGLVLRRAGTADAKRARAAADVSLNSLGYATQQGAWYYYNTAPREQGGRPPSTTPAGGSTLMASTPLMWGERYATASSLFGCAVNISDAPAKHGCKDYGETIVDVKRHADEVSLPYKWWLMDSWWYPKGLLNGVKTWESLPSTFPGSDGRGGDKALAELARATGWSILAHTRFFAADTSYARQNGGR